MLPLLLVTLASSPDLKVRPDTYQPSPGLTTGAIEQFRQLLVDPAAPAANLVPFAPLQASLAADQPASAVFSPPTGDLVIANEHSAWARVRVGDMDIGILGPLTSGTLHDMKSGVYTVTMTYPNGFTLTEMVGTRPGAPQPSGG